MSQQRQNDTCDEFLQRLKRYLDKLDEVAVPLLYRAAMPPL
jgi:hypothetical protein